MLWSHIIQSNLLNVLLTQNGRDTLWQNSENPLGNYSGPTIRLSNFLLIWWRDWRGWSLVLSIMIGCTNWCTQHTLIVLSRGGFMWHQNPLIFGLERHVFLDRIAILGSHSLSFCSSDLLQFLLFRFDSNCYWDVLLPWWWQARWALVPVMLARFNQALSLGPARRHLLKVCLYFGVKV